MPTAHNKRRRTQEQKQMPDTTYKQKLIKQLEDLKGMSDDYKELLDNVIFELRQHDRIEQDIGEMAGILKRIKTPFKCTVSGENRFENSDELIPLAEDYKKMKRPVLDIEFDNDNMNDHLEHEGLDFEYVPPKNKPYTKIYIYEKEDDERTCYDCNKTFQEPPENMAENWVSTKCPGCSGGSDDE